MSLKVDVMNYLITIAEKPALQPACRKKTTLLRINHANDCIYHHYHH
jgi:hypothetical protein